MTCSKCTIKFLVPKHQTYCDQLSLTPWHQCPIFLHFFYLGWISNAPFSQNRSKGTVALSSVRVYMHLGELSKTRRKATACLLSPSSVSSHSIFHFHIKPPIFFFANAKWASSFSPLVRQLLLSQERENRATWWQRGEEQNLHTSILEEHR